MSDVIIAFCERHNLTRMLLLLRGFGPMTNAIEIHALDVIEEIVAGKQDLIDAISEIRRDIHPVEKARKIRAATLLEQEARINSCEAEIRELNARIERMSAELAEKKAQQQQPQPRKRLLLSEVTTHVAREEESQLFECTQPDQADGQETIALLGRV